jgi:hypothetical protein
MPRAATLSAVAVVAVVLAGALIWWQPAFSRDRDYPASIPQPTPLFSTPVIELTAGQRACFGDAVMDTHSEEARFRIGTRRRAGEPLLLAIDGPGYRVRRRVAGGFPDNALLEVAVPAPPEAIAVRVCLRNLGRRRAAIYAASDRTEAPYVTRVDGAAVDSDPQFAFFEQRPVSIAERLPTIVQRLGAFRPGFLGGWLFWPLLALTVAGVPLLVAGALAASLRR